MDLGDELSGPVEDSIRVIELKGYLQVRKTVRNLRVTGFERCVAAGGNFVFEITNRRGEVLAKASLPAEECVKLGDFLFHDPE